MSTSNRERAGRRITLSETHVDDGELTDSSMTDSVQVSWGKGEQRTKILQRKRTKTTYIFLGSI